MVCRYTSLLRRLVGKDKVIGIYYGYVFEDAFGHGRCFASESGHFGIGRVLREAPIDFLVGPVGYAQRTLGSVGPCMGAPATVALHRKLWLDEADMRTSLNGGRAEYSGAADLEESKAVLWRTFGNALVNRAALWWMPISGIRSFSHPDIWRDFGIMYREMARTAAARPALDRSRAIAIIMDTDSIHFRRYSLRDQVAGNLLTLSRDPRTAVVHAFPAERPEEGRRGGFPRAGQSSMPISFRISWTVLSASSMLSPIASSTPSRRWFFSSGLPKSRRSVRGRASTFSRSV